MSRKHRFSPITTPFWDFIFLIDWGDEDLNDTAALGFSLLPRQMEAPLLEHARSFVTVQFTASGPKAARRVATNERMRIVPHRDALSPEALKRRTRNAWEHGFIRLPATLWGMRSHSARSGGLDLRLHFAQHRQAPLLLWQLGIVNASPYPLKVDSITLLRVGPQRKVSKRGRSDFIPTRFRLFKLRRPPTTQSAYYNLTERFGSLRLHALDTFPLTAWQPQSQMVQQALPSELAHFPLAHTYAIGNRERGLGLLLGVGEPTFPATFEAQLNPDPLAPGLTLRLLPQGLQIPAGGKLTLPAIVLQRLTAQNPNESALLPSPQGNAS